jgi:GntR family transcriptional regulator, transcriptional repressor for pyruvate dehydrogenase complex
VYSRAARPSPRRHSSTPAPVTHRVVSHIRRLIRRRRIKPGDRLPTERELAHEMGVSRPSVRAALQFLTAMGVIRSRQGSGTFIQDGPPSLGPEPLGLLAELHGFTAEEIFEARGVLEVNTAGLAAQRATGEQTVAMSEHVASMFACLEAPEEFLVHDVRFHRSVAAGSGNPVLAALVDMLSGLTFEQRQPTVTRARDLRQSAEMHRRIYQAIRRRDAALARATMAEHLQLARRSWAAEDALAAASTAQPRKAARRPAARRK